MSSRPFSRTIADLERVGVPSVPEDADAKTIYVASVRIPRPGTYYILARPEGARRIGGIRDLFVRADSHPW
jgi:hypothetical protein